MAEHPVVIKKISWSDLCPWTIIFRTLPIATSLTVLLLALVGVLATPVGWWASEKVFLNEELLQDRAVAITAGTNHSPFAGAFPTERGRTEVAGFPVTGLSDVFQRFVQPFEMLFSRQLNLRLFAYTAIGALWMVLVWSFVGVAITRVSLVKLTRNEFVAIDDAFRYAIEKWATVAGAIGAPLAAVLALAIPAMLLGLLMTFNLGAALVGILWFIVLGLATAMGVLLIGLMFAWPLMVSSVGCENQNSFDAMTRSYAYTFQRPINYLLYAVIAILFGSFCWLVVSSLTDGIVGLGYWATSWGANVGSADRVDEVIAGTNLVSPIEAAQIATPVGEPPNVQPTGSSTLSVASGAIWFWTSGFRCLATAFLYGLFWCLASAVYLLLRKDVDETEMDEIAISEQERSYQLPPLQSDENGIPQIRPLSSAGDDSSDGSDSDEPL